MEYKHPIFIYIPKHGELRGGAWVVIDPAINPDKMERGGPWGHGGCWSVWEIIEGYRDEVYLNTDANNFLESLRSLVFVPLVLGFLPPLSMNDNFLSLKKK